MIKFNLIFTPLAPWGCSVPRGMGGSHAVAVMRSRTMRAAARYASTHRRSGADLQLHLYHEMARIRAFERRVVDLFARKEIKGMAHSCEGQEATAVGVCAAGLLTDADYVLSHHRGHGHVLAKGADMGRCLA